MCRDMSSQSQVSFLSNWVSVFLYFAWLVPPILWPEDVHALVQMVEVWCVYLVSCVCPSHRHMWRSEDNPSDIKCCVSAYTASTFTTELPLGSVLSPLVSLCWMLRSASAHPAFSGEGFGMEYHLTECSSVLSFEFLKMLRRNCVEELTCDVRTLLCCVVFVHLFEGCCLVFWDRVSLCSPGCPKIHRRPPAWLLRGLGF